LAVKKFFPENNSLPFVNQWHPTKNGDLRITNVSRSSSFKVWWLGECKHEWDARISDRIRGRGCPYCAGKRILPGFNDLRTTDPELAKEWHPTKNDKAPEEVSAYSHKKVWWIDKFGHEWEAAVKDRHRGNGCPYCAGRKVLLGFNDFASNHPKIAEEWDYERNEKKPTEYTCYSNVSVHWKCKEYGHRWKTSINDRVRQNSGCPKCSADSQTSFGEKAIAYYLSKIIIIKENYKAPFLKRRELDIFIPSLNIAIEYDGRYWHKDVERDKKKNDICKENGIELIRVREKKEVIEGSVNYYVGHADNRLLNDAIAGIIRIIEERLGTNFNLDIDVERDTGEIVAKKYLSRRVNSLAIKCPELVREWHPSRNGDLKPDFVPYRSNMKVWWQCEKGHEWPAVISSRVSGNGCPVCANTVVVRGVNDLATTNPKLASEWHPTKNGILKPNDVSAGSETRVWWKGKCGHEWEAVIYSRKTNGCPYCSSNILLKGFNDLETKYPVIAKEWHPTKNANVRPSDVFPNSNKKYWWICKNGHEIEMSPSERVQGRYCGVCSGKVIVAGINDLKSQYPEIAKLWHPSKNGTLTPSEVAPQSNRTIVWLCKEGHEWNRRIADMVNHGSKCPVCTGQTVLSGYNDLAHLYPDILKQWHPTMNNNLDPTKMAPFSNKDVWWICDKGHFWKRKPVDAVKRGNHCPYCNNHRVWLGFNDLATKRPDLALQWHPTRNGIFKPTDFVPGSGKVVWWVCDNCGQEWKAPIEWRTNNRIRCPKCKK